SRCYHCQAKAPWSHLKNLIFWDIACEKIRVVLAVRPTNPMSRCIPLEGTSINEAVRCNRTT
ncbi:MAG: hypothetical protein ACO4AI_14625, partial [Prochlorothrix sp.]